MPDGGAGLAVVFTPRKHKSWLSGRSATGRPSRRACSRTWSCDSLQSGTTREEMVLTENAQDVGLILVAVYSPEKKPAAVLCREAGVVTGGEVVAPRARASCSR